MVGTRYPTGILSKHPGTSDQDVLYSVVEHVPHMQHTCHIWRGDDYSIRFTVIRLRFEEALFHPIGIPFLFALRRIILTCYLHGSALFRNMPFGQLSSKNRKYLPSPQGDGSLKTPM